MKKKFLALVLTLAMVLSLVPATALATNGTQEGDNQGPVEVTGSDNDNNLTMKKTVTPVPNEDGTYTVRLESYAKGEVTTTTTTEPLDIVLLLDVSGSMDEPFTQSSREYRGVYNGSLERNKTYYVKINNKYKEVKYCSKCNAWTNDCKDRLFSGHKGGKKFIPRVSEDDTDVTHTQFYEYVYTEGQSKMGALKQAVNKFIDDIAKNSPESKASIVKFAGKQSDAVGDSKYSEGWYEYNYTQIVQNLTQVNSSGAEQLKRAVSKLEAAGATSSDYGLEKAKAVLDSESATQKKVIILFTDGEPNHDSGFDYEVATNAVNTAQTLKQNNTTIYTVGVFKNPSDDINQYMSSVSSNHPNATAKYTPGENWWDNGAWTVTGGDSDFGTYYKTADSADKLIEAFQTISSQVSSTHLDGNAVVVDNVPSNFALNKGSVKVYTADCTGKNDKGELTWNDTLVNSGINPTIPKEKNDDGSQTISTTGFNFSGNWCGLEGDTAHGKKLIIEFTISRTNYGGTQPTNAGAYIKAGKADNEEPIISLKDPKVPVTISLGIPEAELNEKLGVSSQKEYDGSGISILSELSAKANALANGINNAYVDMELTIAVDEANTYVYKIQAGKQSGDWYQNDQQMTSEAVNDVKTSQDVKRGQNNAVEPYIYNFDLKLSDATPKGAAPAEYTNNTASFTINPARVTVTANDQQVEKGTAPASITYTDTVTGLVNNEAESLISRTIQCEGYTVDTPVGSELQITATGDKEQGNYTVTYRPGKLTVTEAPVTTGTLKVTKEVQGDDLTLKSLPSDFKITVTGPNSYNRSFPLPETVGDSDKTVTWTISDLPTGTYTVSEENADVNGYDCTARYSATNGATVTVNGTASATQNQPATDAQASQKVTVTENRTSTMTVTNKYTKKEVTPEPDTPVELDVSRSKIASGLTKNSNGNWTTDVTLSIPSSEKQLVSDVLFILDESSCSESVKASVNSMLDALYEQIENSGAKIKVGAVQFRGNVTTLPLTELTENTKTEITSFMSSRPEVGGTNMSAGLLKAQKMLDDDTSVMDGRKYVILVSDGITYIWDDETTDAQENLGVNFANADAPNNAMLAGPDGWDVKYGESYIPENWESHFNGIDSMMSTTIQNKASNYERGDNATIGKPFVAYGEKEQYTSTVDIALYKSYNAYKALQEKYNTYAVCSGVEKDMTDFPFGPSFMTYLADGKNVTFNSIQNDILYAVSAGSTVTDIIGSKFSFEGIKSLTVGKQELTATKSGENTWYFGNDNTASESNYRFKVVYNSQDHQFVWTINEKVSNFAPVQLTYTVKLTKPETAAGTYGVTDLNGDEKVDDTGAAFTDNDKNNALYTNESATLVPMNSAGKLGQPLFFPMPSVSYTIKGSSGGHGGNGGGTVTIPDDVPTGLNGKDHYAYVVGYPDGMVYPQKNITRAEVATIFFRLLTDETREANMTKSNGYNDMKDGAWYTCAVSTLSKMGIIKGYEDGSFKPDASISRAEFAAIAARFDPDGDKTPATFSDVSSHWAKDEISIAANHGWIKGYEDGSFKPDQKITRAETMTLVNRVLKRLPETKDDLHKDMKTWPDNQNESAWFYLAVQEATNSHYQKLKKDGTHETWESMRETRDWAALEK